jgi:hypothetical protein
MCLYDEGEVCRVSDIIWSTTRSAKEYQEVVIVVFIELLINKKMHEEGIKHELRKFISAAKYIPNKSHNSFQTSQSKNISSIYLLTPLFLDKLLNE